MNNDISYRGGRFQNRYVITATITTTAPLHIGSGDITHRSGFVKKTKKDKNSPKTMDEPIDIEAIATDATGSPFIPGSVLRGCMGHWLREHKYKGKLLKGLFGWIEGQSSSFTPEMEGKIDVLPAPSSTTAITASSDGLHYWHQKRMTYVARSVAIDPLTGTASEKKLYAFELVPPGVSFKIMIGGQNLSIEEVASILNAIEGFNRPAFPLTLGAMDGRGFGTFRADHIQFYCLTAKELDAWCKSAQSDGNDSAGYQSLIRDDYRVDSELCEKIRIAGLELKHKEKIPPYLKLQWTLRLETPLCIKSGENCVMTIKPQCCDKKARYCKPEFDWTKRAKPEEGIEPKRKADKEEKVEAEVADLYYGIKLEDGEVKPFYMIPGSSIRGTLRSWTIRKMLKKEHWDIDSTLAGMKSMPAVNGEDKSGGSNDDFLVHVADLFGNTAGVNKSKKGRIRVYPTPFNSSNDKITMADVTVNACNAPKGVACQIKVRNPLGRITQAPKEHGLHHFLEVPRGEQLLFTIVIRDPNDFDRELIRHWRWEIDMGFIRFGALTSSIGRGRMKVESENIEEGGELNE